MSSRRRIWRSPGFGWDAGTKPSPSCGKPSRYSVELPASPPSISTCRFTHSDSTWLALSGKGSFQHAGDPDGTFNAKREFLRFRLHSLLADLTGDLTSYAEAVKLRPDLAAGQFGLASPSSRRPRREG